MDLIKNLPQASVPTVNIRFDLKEIKGITPEIPQAYPLHFGNGVFIPGLTIWDYYFTAALNAILTGYSTVGHSKDPEEIVEKANHYANVMMSYRYFRFGEDDEKQEEPPTPKGELE